MNVSIGIRERNREDLMKVRRAVGRAIAQAMVSGELPRQLMAWSLAESLNVQGVEVEYPIRNAMKDMGVLYDRVWVQPVAPDVRVELSEQAGPWSDPWAEARTVKEPDLETVLAVAVGQLRTMATSYERRVREQAARFTTALDEVGVQIDRRIEELSQQLGSGPTLADMFGSRYDLTRQWVDSRGHRWEHHGSWSDVGGPLMTEDSPNGECLSLCDLIRDRGPLFTLTPPPPAVSQPDDEPPF